MFLLRGDQICCTIDLIRYGEKNDNEKNPYTNVSSSGCY